MKFKQLTYTSLEHGWTIERTVGLPETKEIDAFKRISGSRPEYSSLYSYDYRDGVGVLSRSVPYGTDVEKRARYYSHGYVFSGSDCDEVFKDYSALLGIETFAAGVEDPVSEDVKTKRFENLLPDKLTVTVVEGLYESILKNKNMELIYPGVDSELLIKTVMNTVLAYVPLQMRKFISFGSGTAKKIRDIAVTDVFNDYTKIRCNLQNGEITGIDGTYRELIDLLLSDAGTDCLALLEEKIGNSSTDKNVCITTFKTILDDVMFEMSAEKRIFADEIPKRLSEVLDRKRYDNPVDIKVMCNIFAGIKRNDLKLSDDFDEKIAGVFIACNSTELQNAIENYFANKVLSGDKNLIKVMDDLIDGAFDSTLKANISAKLVATKNPDVICYIASQAIQKYDYGKLLLENCNERVVDSISEYGAYFIEESSDAKKFFAFLINSAFYAPVMMKVIDKPAIDLWAYFGVVYKSSANYMIHTTLNKKTILLLNKVFEIGVATHQEDILNMLHTAFLDSDKDFYDCVERMFVENGAKEAVEEFYIHFMAEQADSTREMENQKDKLLSLGLSAEKYISATVQRYAKLCFGEAKHKAGAGFREIEKISLFIGNISMENIESFKDINIKEIKENFWEEFKFNSYTFTNEVQIMRLPKERKSDLANALYDLSLFLSGKVSDFSAESFEICKQELCTDGELLSLRVRNTLLRNLQKLSKNSEKLSLELYLLLNYSNGSKSSNIKNSGYSGQELYDYIETNIPDKNCMLYVGKIYKTIYHYALQMCKQNASLKTKGKRRKSKDPDIYMQIVELMQKQDDLVPKGVWRQKEDIIKLIEKNKAELVYYLVLFMTAITGNITVMLSKKMSVMLVAGMTTVVITAVAEMFFVVFKSLKKKKRGLGVLFILAGTFMIVLTVFLLGAFILMRYKNEVELWKNFAYSVFINLSCLWM